jgi:hypothetical protein
MMALLWTRRVAFPVDDMGGVQLFRISEENICHGDLSPVTEAMISAISRTIPVAS